jgi:hypothetical protein
MPLAFGCRRALAADLSGPSVFMLGGCTARPAINWHKSPGSTLYALWRRPLFTRRSIGGGLVCRSLVFHATCIFYRLLVFRANLTRAPRYAPSLSIEPWPSLPALFAKRESCPTSISVCLAVSRSGSHSATSSLRRISEIFSMSQVYATLGVVVK